MNSRRLIKTQVPEASINITSMLDITFVLLISFMIVAPTLQYSVELSLPKVGEGKEAPKLRPVSVQVRGKEGSVEVFVNGKAAAMETVAATIKASDGYKPESSIALEADRSVPWEQMAILINTLKNNEISNIGIVTEKRSGR